MGMRRVVNSFLILAALHAIACASISSNNEWNTNVDEAINPIGKLDRDTVSFVSVEPMVISGTWIEVRGDGDKIVVRSAARGGMLPPTGGCRLNGEDGIEFLTTLARAKPLGRAGEPVIGDHLIRIRFLNGDEMTARVSVFNSNGPLFAVIGDHRYQPSGSDIETMLRLIAAARC
jgi:hypothetical protein